MTKIIDILVTGTASVLWIMSAGGAAVWYAVYWPYLMKGNRRG